VLRLNEALGTPTASEWQTPAHSGPAECPGAELSQAICLLLVRQYTTVALRWLWLPASLGRAAVATLRSEPAWRAVASGDPWPQAGDRENPAARSPWDCPSMAG